MATEVKEKPPIQLDQPNSRGDVAIFQPARLPFHEAINERFHVDKGSWKVLVEAIFPAAQSVDSVIMALSYCKHRNLDVFKKPVHIVPMWDTKKGGMVETIWPSISELRTTAARTKQYAGIDEAEFGPEVTKNFKGMSGKGQYRKDHDIDVTFPSWCRMTVHRVVAGVGVCKFVGPKVKWLESYATIGATDVPNNMWQERPEGQLEKCAEAAALRRAFPEEIGNEMTAEEMEGRRISLVSAEDAARIVSSETRDDGPPKRAQVEQQKPQQETGSHISGDPVDDIPAKDQGTDKPAGRTTLDKMRMGETTTDQTTGEVTDADYSEVEQQGDVESGMDNPEDGGASMDEDEAKPVPNPARVVYERGMQTDAFADAYIKALEESTEPAHIFAFVDLNRKWIDIVAQKDATSDRKLRGNSERILKRVRDEAIKAMPKAGEKKADPISSGVAKKDRPPADDKPPKRTTKKATDSSAPPTDPEEKLKWICKQLDAIMDPDLLEPTWNEHIEPVFKELDFPVDKDAALAHYGKTEKRLGID